MDLRSRKEKIEAATKTAHKKYDEQSVKNGLAAALQGIRVELGWIPDRKEFDAILSGVCKNLGWRGGKHNAAVHPKPTIQSTQPTTEPIKIAPVSERKQKKQMDLFG